MIKQEFFPFFGKEHLLGWSQQDGYIADIVLNVAPRVIIPQVKIENPFSANGGSPFHAVVLTRQFDTPSLGKHSLTSTEKFPTTVSVIHQSSLTLTPSKTTYNFFFAHQREAVA